MNKNIADAYDHYATRHGDIFGVFFESAIIISKLLGLKKKCSQGELFYDDDLLKRNMSIFAQWNEEGNQTENKGKI